MTSPGPLSLLVGRKVPFRTEKALARTTADRGDRFPKKVISTTHKGCYRPPYGDFARIPDPLQLLPSRNPPGSPTQKREGARARSPASRSRRRASSRSFSGVQSLSRALAWSTEIGFGLLHDEVHRLAHRDVLAQGLVGALRLGLLRAALAGTSRSAGRRPRAAWRRRPRAARRGSRRRSPRCPRTRRWPPGRSRGVSAFSASGSASVTSSSSVFPVICR